MARKANTYRAARRSAHLDAGKPWPAPERPRARLRVTQRAFVAMQKREAKAAAWRAKNAARVSTPVPV